MSADGVRIYVDTNADRRNFLPGAIHAVTALGSGCSVFLANDKRLALPDGIARVPPTASPIRELLRHR